jgi:hypothetical protein
MNCRRLAFRERTSDIYTAFRLCHCGGTSSTVIERIPAAAAPVASSRAELHLAQLFRSGCVQIQREGQDRYWRTLARLTASVSACKTG